MNTLVPTRPPAPVPAAAPPPGRELLPSITVQAPLLDEASARMALHCGERHLMPWILNGDLEWAFDLRRPGSRRGCLRILTASIVQRQQRDHPLTPREKSAQQSHSLRNVFDAVFPHHKPFLLSTELARAWACSPAHIHNLIADGLLGLVVKNYVPREALQIIRETAFQFMQSRRIK